VAPVTAIRWISGLFVFLFVSLLWSAVFHGSITWIWFGMIAVAIAASWVHGYCEALR
jgi:hypothetical protein